MRTLAFVNLKGGTGKTVSAANVAHILAAVHHKHVLLVDADKQGNASRYFHLYGEQDGTAELLMDDAPEPEKEPLSRKRAAYILEDLWEYCEDMMGADGEKLETWADYADALTVAIDALRK